MIVWTLVFNIVTGNIVTPLVYGRMVHLHPAVVLVAIPAGAAIAGMLGMFIVVPAMAVVASTWRTVLAVIGTDRKPVQPARRAARSGGARGRAGHAGALARAGLRVAADPSAAVPPYRRVRGTGPRIGTRLTGDIVMRASRLIIALLVALVGVAWIGQGTGIIGGSAMSGSSFWAIVGLVLIVVAAVIAAREWRLSTSR